MSHAFDHHVVTYGAHRLLTDVVPKWRENYRAAREREWRDAIRRGEATAHQMRIGLQNGLRAPLSFFTRAREADNENACAATLAAFQGIEILVCEIAERMSAGKWLELSDFKRCLSAGVDRSFFAELMALGDVCRARCDIAFGSTPPSFSFGGPDGRLVLAVRDAGFQRVDAVAFRLDDPSGFSVLTNEAVFLGEAHVRDAEDELVRQLSLVADPLAWLAAGGRAVCVLDWKAALPRLRSLGERVTLECDAGAGSELKAKLKIGGLPRVSERAPGRLAA